jgi:hypothetical protein
MSRSPRAFHLLAIVLLSGLGLVLAELAAAAFIWASRGDLPWFGRTAADYRPKVPDVKEQALRLNPYYGYGAKPGMRLADFAARADLARQFGEAYAANDHDRIYGNRHGFVSLYDYPYADPDAFVVGVFGGSVAVQFALTMGATLQEHLAGHPAVGDRRVVLLNFANGGTKQPQHATTLAYILSFGQRFDLVLNLDGFNELFISWYNAFQYGVDERMPYAAFMIGVQNYVLESLGLLAGDNRVAHARARLNEIATALERPQFALRALWLEIEARRAKDMLAQIEDQLSKVDKSGTLATPLIPRSSKDGDSSRENVVRAWLNGSLAMAGMARSFEMPYLHVLQPNQYFSNAKFTDEQRKAALSLHDPPLASLVPAHYRAYLERAGVLRKSGIEFFDASGVFDGSDGSVFHDHCCHLNEAGNRILAAAIADRIKGVLDRHAARGRGAARP